MTTIGMVNYLTANNYNIQKALSGYYYLTHTNEDCTISNVVCDPACEDYYDYDTAVYMFYTHVTEE